MCGKFTHLAATWSVVFDFSQPLVATPSNQKEEETVPMTWAPVMHLDDAARRVMTSMRWGFSKPNRGRGYEYPDLIHARDDKLLSFRKWRELFEAGKRGLLIVHSFFEAREVPTYKPDRVTPTGNFKDEPWVMRPKDGSRLAIACLFRDHRMVFGDKMGRTLGTWIPEFVMVTSKANKRLEEIVPLSEDNDRRMPAILPESALPKWLGEEPAELEELRDLIQPYEDNGAWTYEKAPGKPKKPRV